MMSGTIRTADRLKRRPTPIPFLKKRGTGPMSTPPLDRRKFFGSAAALSLSAAAYGNVVGSNERVRVAFLGCGGRAQAHIDLVNKFASEGKPVAAVAVCDVWD